jgi:hypothetical protein
MNVMRKLLVLALILGLASAAAACGRKSMPEAPPGSTYPRDYPTQ